MSADNTQDHQEPTTGAAAPAPAGAGGSPTVLVADDMSIVREPIAASLRAAGYDVVCAADGKEAMAMIQSRRPELILLDLNMPLLDGLGVMRAMNALPTEFHATVLLLTSDSDRERVLEAAKLGAREYLLKKSFSFGRLLERVAKYLPTTAAAEAVAAATAGNAPIPGASDKSKATSGAAASASSPSSSPAQSSGTFRKLLDREHCVARVEACLKGKTFQGVVMEVISLAASNKGDLHQIATVVSRDPMLSARVLQVANSAAYSGGHGTVSTIPAAVKQIGYAALRNTAAALAVFGTMPPGKGRPGAGGPVTAASQFNPIRCWQHSFAVAQLCDKLMRPVDETAAGTAYVVGLCHDLAEILFQTEFAPEYAQVVKAHGDSGIPIDYLEREMMGVTRDSIIRTILHKLGLPENIAGPIEAYHQWERGGQPPSDRMTRILRLADRYAIGLLLAPNHHAPVGPFVAADCRAAVGIDAPARPDDAQFRSDILALTSAIARLPAPERDALTKPMFAPSPMKVWLARDPTFSAFDPLAAALSSLAQVDVFSELPNQSQDWSDYGAVVVVARSTSMPGFDPTQLPVPSGARAIGGIPVLWAVAKNEAIATSHRVLTTVTLPLTLDDLARFIRSSAASATPPAQAPAA